MGSSSRRQTDIRGFAFECSLYFSGFFKVSKVKEYEVTPLIPYLSYDQDPDYGFMYRKLEKGDDHFKISQIVEEVNRFASLNRTRLTVTDTPAEIIRLYKQ